SSGLATTPCHAGQCRDLLVCNKTANGCISSAMNFRPIRFGSCLRMSDWTLNPDRALPVDPTTRDIARRLYSETSGLPIVSMHGHVEAEAIAKNQHFGDPSELLVIPDHYLVRMLVSQGVTHDTMGVSRIDAVSD